jgi:hypothetical protein
VDGRELLGNPPRKLTPGQLQECHEAGSMGYMSCWRRIFMPAWRYHRAKYSGYVK